MLLDKEEPTCPHCHSSVFTIRHLLIVCPGFCHMCIHYFHSSSPILTNFLRESAHYDLFNFLKNANFHQDIYFLSLLLLSCNINGLNFSLNVLLKLGRGNPVQNNFNFALFKFILTKNTLFFLFCFVCAVCFFWTLCHKKATN